MKIEVNITQGTEAMVSKGMLARAEVNIKNDDGAIIVTLKDILIRNGKDGLWPAPPSKEVGGKYYNFYRFFPEDEDKRKELEATIIKAYNKSVGGKPTTQKNSSTKVTPRAPAKATVVQEDVDFSDIDTDL